jgi:hypothetical protein
MMSGGKAIDIRKVTRVLGAAAATAAGEVDPDGMQPLFWNPKAGVSKGSAARRRNRFSGGGKGHDSGKSSDRTAKSV